jgi:glycosyltransferase involved in cell wall biosynthesis
MPSHTPLKVTGDGSADPPPVQFSVVVPVYNGARFLGQALDSARRQTLSAWECIIVDDGSRDGSYEMALGWARCQSNSVKVLMHPDRCTRGVAESRNLGVRESAAPWIAFLDQDDLWSPTKLERQATYIREHPEVPAVGCVPQVLFDGVERLQLIDDWAAMVQSLDAKSAENLRLRDFVAVCPFCLSGVVARRSVLLAAGGFDPGLERTSDWLMWARLSVQAPLGMVRERLVVYRVHGRNEVLSVVSEPMGAARAMLEMHDHLADCLVMDQGMPRAEAARLIWGLLLETGPAWHRAAARGGTSQKGGPGIDGP